MFNFIRYQPIDGICVNHKHPLKGAINTPYSRIMKNTFDDCKKLYFKRVVQVFIKLSF